MLDALTLGVDIGIKTAASSLGFARRGQSRSDALVTRMAGLNHFSDILADDLLRFTLFQWHNDLTNN